MGAIKVKDAIKFLMSNREQSDSSKFYIKFLQDKIKETQNLREELKQKDLKLSTISKPLHDEFMDCIYCLTFKSNHDNINYLEFFQENEN